MRCRDPSLAAPRAPEPRVAPAHRAQAPGCPGTHHKPPESQGAHLACELRSGPEGLAGTKLLPDPSPNNM